MDVEKLLSLATAMSNAQKKVTGSSKLDMAGIIAALAVAKGQSREGVLDLVDDEKEDDTDDIREDEKEANKQEEELADKPFKFLEQQRPYNQFFNTPKPFKRFEEQKEAYQTLESGNNDPRQEEGDGELEDSKDTIYLESWLDFSDDRIRTLALKIKDKMVRKQKLRGFEKLDFSELVTTIEEIEKTNTTTVEDIEQKSISELDEKSVRRKVYKEYREMLAQFSDKS